MADEPSPTAQAPSRFTLRLTFNYERMNVRLVAGQRVEMIAPRGALEPIRSGQSGFWIELRDAKDGVLYQRGMMNPVRHEMEVPEDPETGALRWVKIDDPQGVFQLLVPDIPGSKVLVLFSSPPDAFYEAAAELARFRLDVKGLIEEVKP